MKLSTSTLGFPRMGPRRELKFALEKYWKGDLDFTGLISVSNAVTDQAWDLQKSANIEHITVGDDYLYDGVLAWADSLGIVSSRHRQLPSGPDRLFAMARGKDGSTALSKLCNRMGIRETHSGVMKGTVASLLTIPHFV